MPTFSETTVKEMLRRWPQAVSLDEADLPRFHQLCCAGEQTTSKPKWADYLWPDLADVTLSEPSLEPEKIYFLLIPVETVRVCHSGQLWTPLRRPHRAGAKLQLKRGELCPDIDPVLSKRNWRYNC